jgi:hypothetical protein
MSSGPSASIFTFLIQFKFYLIKLSRFEKISPPMFLEFHLVFLHNFLDFFPEFPNLNFKNRRFLKSDLADPAEFRQFSEKSANFFNPGPGPPTQLYYFGGGSIRPRRLAT